MPREKLVGVHRQKNHELYPQGRALYLAGFSFLHRNETLGKTKLKILNAESDDQKLFDEVQIQQTDSARVIKFTGVLLHNKRRLDFETEIDIPWDATDV